VKPLEREILMTGIGGQGIQLAARILAEAANQEGRNVMHFGVYGGMIRGGPSDCTIVASTDEILAPPIVEEAWALIAMHGGSLAATLRKVRPSGVVLSNSTLLSPPPARRDLLVMEVPATRLAEEAGKIVGASMVALGAFAEATGFVSDEALIAAMKAAIPPHRQALIEFNRGCIARGAEYVRAKLSVAPEARAWPTAAPAATASG
jgi:Pyruvate/2-oxoacid:ferredoxin oxidoreductase gamma subunit